MKLETLEALQAFIISVKQSPAIETDVSLMIDCDELDTLLEDEIKIKKAIRFIETGKNPDEADLPCYLKKQSS